MNMEFVVFWREMRGYIYKHFLRELGIIGFLAGNGADFLAGNAEELAGFSGF